MNTMDLSSYKGLYVQTAKVNIQAVKSGLASLRKNPSAKDALSEVHRGVHTLKSKSMVMGYQHTGKLSEKLEHLFSEVMEQKTQLTNEVLELSDDAVGALEKAIENINVSGQDIDLSQYVAQIDEILGTA